MKMLIYMFYAFDKKYFPYLGYHYDRGLLILSAFLLIDCSSVIWEVFSITDRGDVRLSGLIYGLMIYGFLRFTYDKQAIMALDEDPSNARRGWKYLIMFYGITLLISFTPPLRVIFKSGH